MPKSTFIVAFYELDRAYGGPEEGGWFYDCGALQRISRIYRTEEAADTAARRANRLLSVLQRGKRDTGSMDYRGGRMAAFVYENNVPNHFPEAIPFYE